MTLAKNGARVALVDLDKNPLNTLAKEIEEKCSDGTKKVTTVHACDVSDSAQVNNLINEIKSTHSNQVPNILVNSAGITRDSFLLKMSEKQFDQVMSVNLKGTFLVTQAVARHLVEHLKQNPLDESTKSYGSIINLASVVGKVRKFVEKKCNKKLRNTFFII